MAVFKHHLCIPRIQYNASICPKPPNPVQRQNSLSRFVPLSHPLSGLLLVSLYTQSFPFSSSCLGATIVTNRSISCKVTTDCLRIRTRILIPHLATIPHANQDHPQLPEQ